MTHARTHKIGLCTYRVHTLSFRARRPPKKGGGLFPVIRAKYGADTPIDYLCPCAVLNSEHYEENQRDCHGHHAKDERRCDHNLPGGEQIIQFVIMTYRRNALLGREQMHQPRTLERETIQHIE